MSSDPSRPQFLIAAGLGATIVLHGALLVAVLHGRAHAGRVAAPQQFGQVVDVQAVKFGKPRDMSFLPHKEAPPTPKPRPKLALTENEHALPKLKDPNEPDKPVEDPLKHVHQFDNPAADPSNTGSAVEEGDEHGLKGGTATVGKGPIYLQHLVAAIQNAWIVPTSFTDAQLARLKAQAFIKIDADGKITEFRIQIGSGNDRFDATLLDALASIKQFEPPTPDVKDIVTGDGVLLNFQKVRDP
jgi:TonB family protein